MSPLVSLVVPVLDEEAAIPIFIEAATGCLDAAGLAHEFIFIDDGSSDSTLEVLRAAAAESDRVRCVSLSRNFGKEAALSAGLAHATGDVIVPIDVDLQDPPELVPTFLERWREGYDVVYGVRSERAADTVGKRWTSHGFYKLFNRVAATQIPANAGDFRLLDRRVVDAVLALPERSRFMKGIFTWVGFRQIGVSYERPERATGRSKWNYWKLWNFALDGITGFSSLPLRVWTYVGLVLATLSFIYMAIVITKVLIFGVDAPGYASLMSVVLFLGGVQLLTLGVLGEYISRLFVEVKQRPLYVVSDYLNIDPEEEPASADTINLADRRSRQETRSPATSQR